MLLFISNPAVSAYASVSTGPHYNIICVIGLPVDSNIEEFLCVCKRTEGFEPEPMTRIAALLANEEQVGRLDQSPNGLGVYNFVVYNPWIVV